MPLSESKSTAELIEFTLLMAGKIDEALEATIYKLLIAWGFTTDSYVRGVVVKLFCNTLFHKYLAKEDFTILHQRRKWSLW